MITKGNLLEFDFLEYAEAWNLQRKLVELRARKTIPDTLILLQHPHVFTVGKGVQVTGDLPAQISGIPVFRIERGGQWTYHGPGQLVGYPILDLNIRQRNIHDFLRKIEETLIRSLAEFGITAERRPGQTGVWTKEKKIASIGAAIRNWASFHGFGLNINTDLSFFGLIEPCGLPSSTMTSMKAILNHELDFEHVKKEVRHCFEEVFEVQLVEVRPEGIVTASAS